MARAKQDSMLITLIRYLARPVVCAGVHDPVSFPRRTATMASVSPDILAAFPLHARPTCPTVLIPFEEQLYSLPAHKLDVNVEFHISTAFVKVTGSWKNIAIYKSDCMFVLPLNGTVTSISIKVANRLYETVVLPKDEIQQIQAAAEPGQADNGGRRRSEVADGAEGRNPYEVYIPNLFRHPISGVASGEIVSVSVSYLEPLNYIDGRYHFTLPLRFSGNLLPDNKLVSDVVSIKATVHSLVPNVNYECLSHHVKLLNNDPRQIKVEVVDINNPINRSAVKNIASPSDVNIAAGSESKTDTPLTDEKAGESEDESNLQAAQPAGPPGTESVDFRFCYGSVSHESNATLLKEEEPGMEDQGTFALFVTPPAGHSRRFARNIVFLLDRSGSMTGDPYVEAMRAMQHALSALNPEDSFNIVCFDHEEQVYSKDKGLLPATPENTKKAVAWAAALQPNHGGTEILNPLSRALRLLENHHSDDQSTLPFVVLLTDGCVANDRQICFMVRDQCKTARILTFGIGFYCNWFFLKTLSQMGRGFSEVVVYKERIFAQMRQLLDAASRPVVCGLQVDIPELDSFDLYPMPLPDLFLGAPLTVAGRFKGRFPDHVIIRGKYADGAPFEIRAATQTSDVVPVSRVFLKQRLDLLSANAWLHNSKEIEEEVVALSCTHSLPSPYTTMLSFQTTEEKKQLLDRLRDRQQQLLDLQGMDSQMFDPDSAVAGPAGAGAASPAGAGAAGDALEPGMKAPKKKWYRDPKKIAALAVGNVVVVGAVAFSFGDIAATLGNLPVMDSFGDGMGMGCCDGCDCDCGDCISC